MRTETAPDSPPRNAVLLPFLILALSFCLLAGGLLLEGLRHRTALRGQLQSSLEQGQKAATIRLHYFELYRDLVALSEKDADAAEIVKKFGIEFTEPDSPAPVPAPDPTPQP